MDVVFVCVYCVVCMIVCVCDCGHVCVSVQTDEVKLKAAELAAERVDNKTRLEIIKHEEGIIAAECKARDEAVAVDMGSTPVSSTWHAFTVCSLQSLCGSSGSSGGSKHIALSCLFGKVGVSVGTSQSCNPRVTMLMNMEIKTLVQCRNCLQCDMATNRDPSRRTAWHQMTETTSAL